MGGDLRIFQNAEIFSLINTKPKRDFMLR